MKSMNFASVLFIAAALGLWMSQHTGAAERPAGLEPGVARSVSR